MRILAILAILFLFGCDVTHIITGEQAKGGVALCNDADLIFKQIYSRNAQLVVNCRSKKGAIELTNTLTLNSIKFCTDIDMNFKHARTGVWDGSFFYVSCGRKDNNND